MLPLKLTVVDELLFRAIVLPPRISCSLLPSARSLLPITRLMLLTVSLVSSNSSATLLLPKAAALAPLSGPLCSVKADAGALRVSSGVSLVPVIVIVAVWATAVFWAS